MPTGAPSQSSEVAEADSRFPRGPGLQSMEVNKTEWTKKMKPPKTSPLLTRNCINRSGLRRGFFLITLTCFALSPTVRAVDPPPDGGYPNGNTAEGDNALQNLTTGDANTAIGNEALFNNMSGRWNTATGFQALFRNTTGPFNTATGVQALQRNTSGGGNTAIGVNALESNTTGSANTATGASALESNTTGRDVKSVVP
jgi:trimeric autotransporter adhesin